MSIGKIVQVIGAVVDIEFPRDEMPKVYDYGSGWSEDPRPNHGRFGTSG